MNRMRNSRVLAVLLVMVIMVHTCVGSVMQSYAYTERTATVNATVLNVRSGPGTTYSIVDKLSLGATVTVIGEKNASDGALWYQIRFTGSNGTAVTGYASKAYLKFQVAYTSDGDFEAHLTNEGFPESYKVKLRQLHAQYPTWVFRAQKTGLDWNTAVQNESVVGRNLVASNSLSSWKSIADGAYNWDTSSWPGFDGPSWVAASEEIIRFYMDPRNFLDEYGVFQFLLQSYDSSTHTADGLKTMVKGTFLEGSTADGSGSGSYPSDGTGPAVNPGGSGSSSGSAIYGPGANLPSGNPSSGGSSTGYYNSTAPTGNGKSGVKLEGPQASISRHVTDILMTSGPGLAGPADAVDSSSYINIIMNAGAQSGVNPYVLAAMIIQEQGSNGSGKSISGREPGYEGYYNFYNIGAYQSGSMSAIQMGLSYASQSGSYERPWNSVEKAIIGGAQYYSTNFVKAGQDTFYLKKFNVQGSNMYKHQYMTNVQGAAAEGAVYAKAYNDAMKQTALEFKIPVYHNMPDNPVSKPTVTGSPNNKLSNLSVSGFVMTPTFNRDVLEYNLIVDSSVSSVTVNATTIDSTASVSGAGNIPLQSGNNEIKVAVTAQNGSIRVYVIHIVRQGGSSANNQGGAVYGPGGSTQSGDGASTPGGDNVTIIPVSSRTDEIWNAAVSAG